eukprot:COSAG03_NODE_25126_length_267_cov_1.505952_2_plen_31_part_01
MDRKLSRYRCQALHPELYGRLYRSRIRQPDT